MSTIIINIFIAFIVLVPMGYFMFGGNKIGKLKIKEFKSKCLDRGISLDKVSIWQTGEIGVNIQSKKLCYVARLQSVDIQTINLLEVQSCEVSKTYLSEKAHDQTISILKSVGLLIKMKNKTEVNIPFYDNNITTHPGSDLIEAQEWSVVINKVIKN